MAGSNHLRIRLRPPSSAFTDQAEQLLRQFPGWNWERAYNTIRVQLGMGDVPGTLIPERGTYQIQLILVDNNRETHVLQFEYEVDFGNIPVASAIALRLLF